MSGSVTWSPVSNQHTLDLGFESCSSFRNTLIMVFEREFPMSLGKDDLSRLEIIAKLQGHGVLAHNPYEGLIELITQVGTIRLEIEN